MSTEDLLYCERLKVQCKPVQRSVTDFLTCLVPSSGVGVGVGVRVLCLVCSVFILRTSQ